MQASIITPVMREDGFHEGFGAKKRRKLKVKVSIYIIGCEQLVSRPRRFDRVECKNCIFKGGSYCWNQCPYNIWRRQE
jgi:hypothetical protein